MNISIVDASTHKSVKIWKVEQTQSLNTVRTQVMKYLPRQRQILIGGIWTY